MSCSCWISCDRSSILAITLCLNCSCCALRLSTRPSSWRMRAAASVALSPAGLPGVAPAAADAAALAAAAAPSGWAFRTDRPLALMLPLRGIERSATDRAYSKYKRDEDGHKAARRMPAAYPNLLFSRTRRASCSARSTRCHRAWRSSSFFSSSMRSLAIVSWYGFCMISISL